MTSGREVESRNPRSKYPYVRPVDNDDRVDRVGYDVFSAGRAAVGSSRFQWRLTGRHNVERLELTFPDFAVFLDGVTHLEPNFSEGGNGTLVPFTQTSGSFSGHSIGDMDVGPSSSGRPTPRSGKTKVLPHSEAVSLSGFLKVTQFG